MPRNPEFPGAPAGYKPRIMAPKHVPYSRHEGCYSCGSLALDLRTHACSVCGLPLELNTKRAGKRWRHRRFGIAKKRMRRHGRQNDRRVLRG